MKYNSTEVHAPLAPTRAEIDLSRLARNATVLQQRAGQATLMAVVKANAYGHGAAVISETLRRAGVRFFAVATIPEGVELRKSGLDAPVLVMGAPLPAHFGMCEAFDLDVLISDERVADEAIRYAASGGKLRVHPKVDTGMGRVGMSREAFARTVPRLEKARGIHLIGFWTHFAVADEVGDPFTETQWEAFESSVKPFADTAEFVHLANSALLLRFPSWISDRSRTIVRSGLSLYGYSPLNTLDHADLVEPVMRFVSRITQVKTVSPGTTVSYGRTWTAEEERVIATVNAGYADGYPRGLSNRGTMGVRGKEYPVAGRVCMDMTMLDLGSPESARDIDQGQDVVLWGEGGPSLYDVATTLKTIPYALTCGVTRRVERVYLEEN